MKKFREKKSEEVKAAAENAEVNKAGEMFDWLQCIVFALIVCILVFTFIARTVGVIGGSMENTLFEGERLVISKLFYTPQHGDIVVLRQDTFRNEPIVKRVIATEGQTVDIDFEECVVYVDGVALDEPYTKDYGNYTYYDPQDFEGEVTVPEGCIFVMGDNRNGSTDSRTESIGFVDTRKILGKVILRIGPLDRIGFVE